MLDDDDDNIFLIFLKGVLRPALSWPGAGRHQDPKPSAWESSEADLVMLVAAPKQQGLAKPT